MAKGPSPDWPGQRTLKNGQFPDDGKKKRRKKRRQPRRVQRQGQEGARDRHGALPQVTITIHRLPNPENKLNK